MTFKHDSSEFTGQIIFSVLLITLFPLFSFGIPKEEQEGNPELKYSISMTDPGHHNYHVDLSCPGLNMDTVVFKMPRWMPGYYQIMNYGKEVRNLTAKGYRNESISVIRADSNTWKIPVIKKTPFTLSYDVKADRHFVANSYLDSTHVYIIPEATFFYIEGHLNTPVSVKMDLLKNWNRIVTGLDSVPGKADQFSAPDFDVLYDCPLLAGNLEELTPFTVFGIKHRFTGYELGTFDRNEFIKNLEKVIKAGIGIIGDVPYKQYSFIAIGRGYGGIEHLNNTTVSFDGTGMDKKNSMHGTLSYLAHEYFHCYNVKCIRPCELGPFDYDNENRTNLLWVSEGLTVYYEYLILNRAAISDDKELFSDFEGEITTLENNPGRNFQSLIQASYDTWSEGPFGNQGTNAGKTISYYNKGPIVGLILDLSIRKSTANRKSLDDVMRLLYREFYREKRRGFTDAEFREACEKVAGTSLDKEFEYVYTTKEIDYNYYLSFAGLKLSEKTGTDKGKKMFSISRIENPDSGQVAILKSWLHE